MSDPIDLELVRANPVRFSSRAFSEECALADAADAMDSAHAGVIAVSSAQRPTLYEFSNGRSYKLPRDPYA